MHKAQCFLFCNSFVTQDSLKSGVRASVPMTVKNHLVLLHNLQQEGCWGTLDVPSAQWLLFCFVPLDVKMAWHQQMGFPWQWKLLGQYWWHSECYWQTCSCPWYSNQCKCQAICKGKNTKVSANKQNSGRCHNVPGSGLKCFMKLSCGIRH